MIKKRAKKISKKSRPKLKPKKAKQKMGKAKRIRIRVVGIGGGGSSIVSELVSRMKKISFVVANTDSQALKTASRKALHFQFGSETTRGLGTGMNPDLGKEAALKDIERIKKLLMGYDFCVLVSSLGGGTGSGAAPIFAKTSRDLGNITYGIFTLPFKFEGDKKMEIAKQSLKRLKSRLDIFSVIPNERIFQIIDKKTPLKGALSIINNNLAESLEGLIDMIYTPGLINIDFADFKTILSDPDSLQQRKKGKLAYLNTVSIARKKDTTKDLIESVLYNPLYPYTINGSTGILLNIGGEKNLSLAEVNRISRNISGLADKEAKIIFGISQGKKYSGVIKTTLLATGCKAKMFPSRKKPKSGKTIKKKEKVPIFQEKPGPESIVKKEGIKIKKKKKVKKKRKPVVKKIKKNKKANVATKKKRAPVKKGKIKISVVQKEEPRVRKNALQIRKEMEQEEKEILEKEKFWETPAFLRRK